MESSEKVHFTATRKFQLTNSALSRLYLCREIFCNKYSVNRAHRRAFKRKVKWVDVKVSEWGKLRKEKNTCEVRHSFCWMENWEIVVARIWLAYSSKQLNTPKENTRIGNKSFHFFRCFFSNTIEHMCSIHMRRFAKSVDFISADFPCRVQALPKWRKEKNNSNKTFSAPA